jgi:hypothetical protein
VNGRLAPAKDANVLILSKSDFEVRELFSLGERMVVDGQAKKHDKFLENCNRSVVLTGAKKQRETLTEEPS